MPRDDCWHGIRCILPRVPATIVRAGGTMVCNGAPHTRSWFQQAVASPIPPNSENEFSVSSCQRTARGPCFDDCLRLIRLVLACCVGAECVAHSPHAAVHTHLAQPLRWQHSRRGSALQLHRALSSRRRAAHGVHAATMPLRLRSPRLWRTLDGLRRPLGEAAAPSLAAITTASLREAAVHSTTRAPRTSTPR